MVAFDFDGSWAWDALLSTTMEEAIFGLAVDRNGHVVVSGERTLMGGQAALFANLDGCTGDVRWERAWAGGDLTRGNAVATNAVGTIALTGTFSGAVNFGEPQTRVASGLSDAFVATFVEVPQ